MSNSTVKLNLFLLFASWFAAGVGCAPPSPPNVVVVLIDALRADHLSAYGYERATSPNLELLAAESVVFTNAHAQSPWTKPSVPTLFTSLYPVQHGVYEGEAHGRSGGLESDVLGEHHDTLAEHFATAGYETVAWVNNAHLEEAHGFAQGFVRYEHESFDAGEINSRFFEFLDTAGSRPFFAYLHYLDVHWPFQPGAEFRDRFGEADGSTLFDRKSWRGLRDGINNGTVVLSPADETRLGRLHDAAILAFDRRLGELVDALRQRGLLENTVLLITSDHGEELLDHGRVGHGGTLYREVIEIPLLVRVPGGRARLAHEPARLVDVLPTLLAAAGLPEADGVEGRDLLASHAELPELVAETRHKRTYRVSVREGPWKYVRTYRAARGPRSSDPSETDHRVRPGMRVKAKGLFTADGGLRARKLSLKDAGDQDLELTGPIDAVDVERMALRVRGQSIDAEDVLAADGSAVVSVLSVGDWVKVEAQAGRNGVLVADEIELVSDEDRDDEVEGIVTRVEPGPDEALRLVVGPVVVTIDDDTRLRGFDAAGPVTPVASPAPAPADDPFQPTVLLSDAAPPFEHELLNLALDPEERVDVAADEPERLAGMQARLEAWLTRMAAHPRTRSARRTLDAATVEELRILGYVE